MSRPAQFIGIIDRYTCCSPRIFDSSQKKLATPAYRISCSGRYRALVVGQMPVRVAAAHLPDARIQLPVPFGRRLLSQIQARIGLEVDPRKKQNKVAYCTLEAV